MEHPSLRALLGRIGLDAKEVSIYLALLALRSARASTIATSSGQSRSHTYLVLQSLIARGLVSKIERGKVLHFVAESPEHLLSYLEDKTRELSELSTLVQGALPQLKFLTPAAAQEPRVTLLHGIDGMKQVYREIFPNAFCALFNPEVMYRTFDIGLPQLLLKNGQALRGRDLLVDNAASRRFIRENPENEEYKIRVLPKGVTFRVDTMVYGKVMILMAYDSDHTIIRIENQNIADSFRAWFEVLWKAGRKAVRK